MVVAVAIVGGSATIGGTLVNEFTIPDSDAQRATDLLEQRFPQQSGESAQLVFAVPEGQTLAQGQAPRAIRDAIQAAAAVPGVEDVGNPLTGDGGDVSDDRRIAYVDVQFSEQSFDVPKEDVDQLKETTEAAVAGSGVELQFTGPVIQNSEPPATGTSELLGLIAAIIILLIMLGSVVAAGLPIVLALVSVGLGLSLLTLAAAVTNFNTITPVLATMLGLGVGIDYSLFIVTRFRQGIHDGLSGEHAAAAAVATAGRAVVFAGLTVAISISALAVIGLDFITKLGLGAAITVVTAVAAAITLLPAILSLLGPRIDKGRVPFTRRRDASTAGADGTMIARWGRFVTRHARTSAIAATALIVILSIPVFSVQLGSSDAGSNPPDTTTRQAYDLLAEGFGPGFNGPLLVTVDQGGAPGRRRPAGGRLPRDAGRRVGQRPERQRRRRHGRHHGLPDHLSPGLRDAGPGRAAAERRRAGDPRRPGRPGVHRRPDRRLRRRRPAHLRAAAALPAGRDRHHLRADLDGLPLDRRGR